MLVRKVSQGVSILSQSAASGVSSSRRRLPVRRRVADFSLGWGGLGAGVAAQVVFRESRAFLERVGSSKESRESSGVLVKLIRTWRLLISSLLWIWSWV